MAPDDLPPGGASAEEQERAAMTALYGAPLADFMTVRRDAASRIADPAAAARIRALRKPTVAAWLLNQLSRRETTVIARLGDLGSELRAAQSAGDGARLRQLRPRREALVTEVVDEVAQAAADAGLSCGPATRTAASDTAIAVLADARSAAALAAGLLLRPLHYAGFGEVELDDAIASPLRLVPPLADTDSGADADVLRTGAITATSESDGDDRVGATRIARGAEIARQQAQVAASRRALMRADATVNEAEQAERDARDLAMQARAEVQRSKQRTVEARQRRGEADAQVRLDEAALRELLSDSPPHENAAIPPPGDTP